MARAPSLDPFFLSSSMSRRRSLILPVVRSMLDVKRDSALTHNRISTDQKHVTLVANAHLLRVARQRRGVVAAGVAEDVPAVTAMMLATSEVELTVTTVALGDLPIVRPRSPAAAILLRLPLSIVSSLA